MRLLKVAAMTLLPLPASAEDFAPMALNSHTALPVRIQSATVFQQDGTLLGNVQGVDKSPTGIQGIRVGVSGPRVITLGAAQASYDAVNNVVVLDADATKDAMNASPRP